jgi:hypothetical protein
VDLTYDLWHLAFANLMQDRVPPHIEVQSEVRLTIEPQRADVLLLRRTGAAPQDDQARLLRLLWPWLAEQRLAGLDHDQQALALPVDVLRLLPEDYLRSLSPEVREEILERLRRANH